MTTESSIRGLPVGRFSQVLLGLWSLFLICGFSLAVALKPDPRGYGTHRRLGLPPCTCQAVFDIPCPTCGMTTSFANFVRGRFLDSLSANPAGFLLACVCAIQIPWCWLSIYQRRLYGIEQPERALLWIMGSVLGLSIIQWTFRVL